MRMTSPLPMTSLLMLLLTSFLAIGDLKAQSYKHLKALLIVGEQQDGTKSSMERMDDIATLFQSYGIAVYKFYDEDAEWTEITRVAPECSFLVYDGHGSTMGDGGKAGGLCINSMVSAQDIRQNLKLRNNALVLFQSVCYGAGSSAGDDDDIGLQEAKNRVSEYADSFFDVGARGYYANNYTSGIYHFLNDFLGGENLKQAYLNSTNTWTDIEFQASCEKLTNSYFSIASSPDRGGVVTRTRYSNGVKSVEQIPDHKDYDIACVGLPDLDIKDFK